MRRFGAVAAGQLVSMTGSALTAWALPVWLYLQTGSLVRFTLLATAAVVPGLLVSPLAGAVVDRTSRRAVMLASGAVAGGAELGLAVLYGTGALRPWQVYAAVAMVAAALAFQRPAFAAAVPQLVPKRYLGNANGIAQLSGGLATLAVPLLAAGLLAAIGLGNILLLDVASYAFAITVTAAVRFPGTLGRVRREPLLTEVGQGLRYAWRHRYLRAALLFSALVNVFLGPTVILVSPLVLATGGLRQLGEVSFANALGATAGGLLFAVWGGPARRRMRGFLLTTYGLAGCLLLTGVRPGIGFVATGVAGTAVSLAVVQSIYVTIVQTKVPQRFHGRIFALSQMIAWSTLPLGFAVLAPLAVAAFGPLLAPHGALAGTVGRVVGTGPGRGIALVYVVVALAVAAATALAARTAVLSRFDAEVPDATPDDLVGVAELAGRRAGGKVTQR
jgi:MFS family permease